MESSPAAVGGRRRSLRTLRTNPERLAECGHDLMHVDLASDRDLKCDICWRNRETLILRLLEPFERALKVEPEELQKILAQEQQERERKAEEDRRMREKREDERRRKEEESKRKRERMRAMQEARRGKGGKFEKKPKVDHRPSGSETSSTAGGKRRGENGKFVKAGSADQSSEGSMSMERDMEATPEVMGWGESSWSPEVMETKFTFRQATPTPTEWERNTQSSADTSTSAAAAATDTESVDNTTRSPVYGPNGVAGYVKQEPDTAMEGYPSVAVDAKPIEPILAEPLPCQQRQCQNGESHARAAPLTGATAQPEIIPKEEVMEDVSLDLTAPPASAQFEVAPGPTIDTSPHPPPLRLQSPSRASSSIADVATAPAVPPLAPPPPPTAHPIEASVRVQPPPQTATDGRATRHRSSSSTRSACKPVVPTTKMKAKAKPQGRRASDTSTVSPPAPVQQLRFIHTSAPPSQPLHQRTIPSFFSISGTAAPTPPPIFTAGGNAGFPAVASSSAAVAMAQRDRELKRALRGREAVRLRDEDPNRRKSQRSSAATNINYFESSDEDGDDDGEGAH